MKRKELEKKLKSLGWKLNRHGRRHDVWTKDEYDIVVSRHNEINEYTAMSILKNAGEA
jgi:predicted RNA binding protein YcfA (HicA-like mRNA interferase family)